MNPDPGTWQWIVAGLATALAALATVYNKFLIDRIRVLEEQRGYVTQKWEEAMRDRYQSEMEVVKVLTKATEVIESALRRLPPPPYP